MTIKPVSIGIVGSRTAGSEADYRNLCEFLQGRPIARIVSGGARGADALARRYATDLGIMLVEHLPDYRAHGRGAPIVRNGLIVAASDEIVALWDGESRGTADTIRKAEAAGKPVHIIRIIR